jgi:Do/DeqQ family serine protease
MKKIVSSVLMATLGGFFALATAHFIYKGHSEGIQKPYEKDQAIYKLSSTSAGSGANTDFILAAEKSVNAVVHIKTTSEQVSNLAYDPFAELFFGPQKRQQSFIQQGSGSGVIISEDGYIVTNNHVINGATKIEVILNDKRSYEAELIGADASTDVALIRIKEDSLPFLAYGNSDAVRVGEWVLAVGNPFNLNSTVTAGIISAKGRNNILSGNQRPIESFIQTDAAVNPGNSGGALVNTEGELVGINTAIASNNGTYQGYSFAVPVNIVKKIVSDLVEFGTVQRAYIGVNIQDIDAKFASDNNIKQLKGVYVNGISAGGSAEDAGIRKGDVITHIHDIAVGSVSELQEQVSRYRPGDKIKVAITRDSKEINLPLTLKTFDNTTQLVKKSDLIEKKYLALGAEFSDLNEDELTALRIENGVKIQKAGNGKLAQVGIQSGFIITSIDKRKTRSAKELKNLLDNKTGSITIEGFYPNGMRATYSFGL